MNKVLKNFLLLGLMIAASGLAVAMRPTEKLANTRPELSLETMIPEQFGDWHSVPANTAQIVDPQQLAFVTQIYKQTLSRSYANAKGQLVMLSVAYVEDQSDSFGVHLPEVCYPSQGFIISEQHTDSIQDQEKILPVKRLVATQGGRTEPITYWNIVGNTAVGSGMERKLAQMQHAFAGHIPDGMLVRISSIEKQPPTAFAVHSSFARDLRNALSADGRLRLYGEAPAP